MGSEDKVTPPTPLPWRGHAPRHPHGGGIAHSEGEARRIPSNKVRGRGVMLRKEAVRSQKRQTRSISPRLWKRPARFFGSACLTLFRPRFSEWRGSAPQVYEMLRLRLSISALRSCRAWNQIECAPQHERAALNIQFQKECRLRGTLFGFFSYFLGFLMFACAAARRAIGTR